MSGECEKCGEHALDCHCPLVTNRENIDKFVEKLMTQEVKPSHCLKCQKEYWFNSYGHHMGQCDECWFFRFPKEEREVRLHLSRYRILP